jgi:hypothetical protein
MAKWRKKAYETFRFRPGSYSHTYGSVDLMADLITLVRRAVHDGNEDTLVRVLEYVLWAAAQQGAPGLASAVDLAFFLPGFRDHELCSLLRARLPEGLFAEKWRILMEEPPLPGEAAGA